MMDRRIRAHIQKTETEGSPTSQGRTRWNLQGARRTGMTRRSFVRVVLSGAGLAAAGTTALLSGCSQSEAASDKGGSDGSDNGGKKLNVAASFYPMYDFAKKIGGAHVAVSCLVPAGTEPHDWEPSPTDIASIEDSDLLVYNGASMEHWIDDVKNASDGSLAYCEASEGIDLRAGEAEDDEEDDGPIYDPHVWLSPANAKIEMGNIRDALSKIDPEHASDYDANYTEFSGKLDELDTQFREKLSTVPNKTIVVSHEAFGYLCDAYGLTQVAITGMDAEGEPDAQTMASIIDQVKATGIKTIFGEELVSQKVAKQIADATGAECKVLNPIEGLEQSEIDAGEDYFSVMRSNLDELVAALS